MNICPRCQTETLVKAGCNRSGSQRYRCKACTQYTTPAPKQNGYPLECHEQALKLYLEGNGLRRIARWLHVTHQTISNWIDAMHAQLPAAVPQPITSEVTELDELFTFVGQKKNEVYVVTAVDRTTRCIVGHAVVPHRTFETFQEVVDQGPPAQRYFSDGLAAYSDVYYRGAPYMAVLNKSQTYSVEGDNAERRHYLARLHRSTRCFSKSLEALRRAVDLFVYFWNRRQLRQRTQPQYPVNLIDCISLRV